MPIESEFAYQKVLHAFGTERNKNPQPPSELELKAVADLVGSNRDAANQLISKLFPNGTPMDVTLYAKFFDIQRWLGFSENVMALSALLFTIMLQGMTEPQRETAFNAVVGVGNRFFDVLRLFPTVVKSVHFSPSFMLSWFVRVRQRIGKDLMQGDYWNMIGAWSFTFPSDAIINLRQLVQAPLDDESISMSACILGNIRVVQASKAPDADLNAIEQFLEGHSNPQLRIVYYRSWINTGWHFGYGGQ